jgi:serine/threonine-protein kinase
VTDVVPAPSTLVPHLPAQVDALVEGATESDPDARPGNAEQMLALVRSTRQELPEAVLDIRPKVPLPLPFGYGHTEVVRAGQQPPGTMMVNGVAHHTTRAMPMLRSPVDPILMPGAPPARPGRSLMQARRRRGRIALGVVFALVAALGVTSWWFTGGPGAYTRAPIVVGQKAAQAVALLRTDGLGADQRPTYDEQIPAGVVISSDPKGGEKVRKGGTVTLLVSRGRQLFAVPKLAGLGQDAAQKLLEQNSLGTGEVSRKYNDEVASGLVVSSDPEPGTKLARDSAVALVVSKGPHPVQVPNFLGQQQDQAVAELDQLKLKNKVIKKVNDPAPAGTVLGQDPPEGGEARVGDTVTLVVSSGPPLVQVPDVKDKKFDEAKQILEGQGFQVQRQGTGILDRVVNQSPDANAQAPQGSVVVVTTF